MFGDCAHTAMLSYMPTGLGALWLWWTYLERGAHLSPMRRVWQQRLKALAVALIALEFLRLSAFFVTNLSDSVIFGACLGLIICLREALDPSLPGFWHHRRIRPLALVLVPSLSGLVAWLVAHNNFYAALISIAVYSRHLQCGARISEQNLSEIEPLRQKIHSLNAALHTRSLHHSIQPEVVSRIVDTSYGEAQAVTSCDPADTARRA